MNYEDPKDKEFIIKLVQEYIDLQDQRGEGFSIIYTQDRIKKQFLTLNNQIKKEIKRIAKHHKEEKGEELTIYNCFDCYLYTFLYDKITTINNYLIKIESKRLTKGEILDYQKDYLRIIWYISNYIKTEAKLLQYDWKEYRPYRQRIPSPEELINGTYSHLKEYKIAKERYPDLE